MGLLSTSKFNWGCIIVSILKVSKNGTLVLYVNVWVSYLQNQSF